LGNCKEKYLTNFRKENTFPLEQGNLVVDRPISMKMGNKTLPPDLSKPITGISKTDKIF